MASASQSSICACAVTPGCLGIMGGFRGSDAGSEAAVASSGCGRRCMLPSIPWSCELRHKGGRAAPPRPRLFHLATQRSPCDPARHAARPPACGSLRRTGDGDRFISRYVCGGRELLVATNGQVVDGADENYEYEHAPQDRDLVKPSDVEVNQLHVVDHGLVRLRVTRYARPREVDQHCAAIEQAEDVKNHAPAT